MVISHSVVFLLGVTCAKLYDRDELMTYREAHEKPMQKLRRYAGNALLGSLALGSMWLIVGVSSRGNTGAEIQSEKK